MIGPSKRPGYHARAGGTCSSTAGEAEKKKHSLIQPKQTIGGPGLTRGALTDVSPHARCKFLLFMTLLSHGESIQLGGVREIISSFNLSQENTAGLDRQGDKLRPTKRERCSVGNLRSIYTDSAIASALGGTSAESSVGRWLSTQ